VESGREELGLRAILSLDGDDLPFGKRAAAIDAKELTLVAVGHMDIRCRCNAEEDDDYTGEPYHQGHKRVPDSPKADLRTPKSSWDEDWGEKRYSAPYED